MYRIILVDDEPLILAGITSLLTWEDHDCIIVGKANNGSAAYELITELKPDIVITDIRMPVLDGIQLIEKCKENKLPIAYIILTNLEDFALAKKAINLGAVDYLVKLDLTSEELINALDAAKKQYHLSDYHMQRVLPQSSSNEYSDRNFFMKYLQSMDPTQSIPASLDTKYTTPFVLVLQLRYDQTGFHMDRNLSSINEITEYIISIMKQLVARFYKTNCIFNTTTSRFLIIASYDEETTYEESLAIFCQKLNTVLKTYFELSAVYGISSLGDSLSSLHQLSQEAHIALDSYYYDSGTTTVFYNNQEICNSRNTRFDINFLKTNLAIYLHQNNSQCLYDTFLQLIDIFREFKPTKEQATSACINLYTFISSEFESEGHLYPEIFPYTSDIAEYLRYFTSLDDIIKWLEEFGTEIHKLLQNRQTNPSDKLIAMTKQYIEAHYTEKLSLTDIAEALNISAGHLSTIFKKGTGYTTSDYIAKIKISHAKTLLDSHQYLIYEISNQLGFENQYYFSKVFKKITGISPKEYERQNK